MISLMTYLWSFMACLSSWSKVSFLSIRAKWPLLSTLSLTSLNALSNQEEAIIVLLSIEPDSQQVQKVHEPQVLLVPPSLPWVHGSQVCQQVLVTQANPAGNRLLLVDTSSRQA